MMFNDVKSFKALSLSKKDLLNESKCIHGKQYINRISISPKISIGLAKLSKVKLPKINTNSKSNAFLFKVIQESNQFKQQKLC